MELLSAVMLDLLGVKKQLDGNIVDILEMILVCRQVRTSAYYSLSNISPPAIVRPVKVVETIPAACNS